MELGHDGIMHAIHDPTSDAPMNEFDCPTCTAPGLVVTSQNILACSYCGSSFQHDRITCPACRSLNTPEAENCARCGEPLTLISQVMLRHGGSGFDPLSLRQSRARAAELKERGEQASLLRMQNFLEQDRRREQAVAEAEAERSREQKQLFKLMVIVGSIFILLVLIVTTWQLLT